MPSEMFNLKIKAKDLILVASEVDSESQGLEVNEIVRESKPSINSQVLGRTFIDLTFQRRKAMERALPTSLRIIMLQ